MMKAPLALALILLAAISCAQGKTIDGIAYGEKATLSGIWFTNFENSRFLECSDSCEGDSLSEWASIACADKNCAMLDQPARRIMGAKSQEPPEGAFRIRFIGRRGLAPHKSLYLGDGGKDVWIDQVLEISQADEPR